MSAPARFTFTAADVGLACARREPAVGQTGLSQVRSDDRLDRITRLAVAATGAPIALVTLIEPTRQVFASAQGLPPHLESARETPLSQSFCQYVVLNDAPLVVGDARAHPVLHQHPGLLVNEVVAYAGHPVHHPDGTVVGTLCAADSVPREWTPEQLAALADLVLVLEADIAVRVRRSAAERLRVRMQGVMDAATSTAIVAADLDGVISFVNRGAVNLFGVQPEELVGVHRLEDLRGFGHPVGRGGSPGSGEDWILTDAAGEQRVVSVRVATVRDQDGAVTGSMLLADDVSARHRAEELLRETLRKQATVVEQMKALDRSQTEFIATASHELRTPATSILGYTELLTDGSMGPVAPQQAGVLERIQRNSERLVALIEDLLTLSRGSSTQAASAWTTVDLGEEARSAWEALEPHLVGRSLAATFDVPSKPVTVRGDAVELERVVLNLLTNAVKYTADGGEVRLEVRRTGQTAMVVVSDTGIGIAPDDQARVFEPFFRTQEAQQQAIQGAGLGLALVRQLAQAHGGSAELASEPGTGTTVTVRLPASV